MALGEADKFAFERVFPEPGGQRLGGLEQSENVFERLVIEGAAGKSSLQAAEVAFKTPREDDLLHRRLR